MSWQLVIDNKVEAQVLYLTLYGKILDLNNKGIRDEAPSMKTLEALRVKAGRVLDEFNQEGE